MDSLLREWKQSGKKIYVYTKTVRLDGLLTHIGDDHLVLDGHVIVFFQNTISITDIEQMDRYPKKQTKSYNFD